MSFLGRDRRDRSIIILSLILFGMAAGPDGQWNMAAAGDPCPLIGFVPNTLPNGAPGVVYDERILAFGGDRPYTYSRIGGSLPPGLTLTSAGYLQGTPTTGGRYQFDVRAVDANSCSGSRSYTLIVGLCPAIVANPEMLPPATAGVPYRYSVTASGGVEPYHFNVVSGRLPRGLTMDSSGRVTGTPTEHGDFDFLLRARDAHSCTDYVSSTITVICPDVRVGGPPIVNATVGVPYDNSFFGFGGTAPYTFSVVVGTLPPGMDLSPSGRLSGTPTAVSGSSFTVMATDANGCTGIDTIGENIVCPQITITPGRLPSGTLGAAYDQQVDARGGTSPFTFALKSGSFPPGLTLAANGTISGKPTVADSFNFSLKVTDTHGCVAAETYDVFIGCPAITLEPDSPLPKGSMNVPYSQQITATGGVGPYKYRIDAGSLPPELTLSPAGTLSGLPRASGSYSFDVLATGASHCSGKRTYVLAIGPPITPTRTRTPTTASSPPPTATGSSTHPARPTFETPPTVTRTLASTGTVTASPTATRTRPSVDPTMQAPTRTFTHTATPPGTISTATVTPVNAETDAPTASPTRTPPAISTATWTATPSVTPFMPDATPLNTETAVPAASPTYSSSMPSASATPTLPAPGSTSTPTPTASPTPPSSVCTGDCDASGDVAIDELILGVSIALSGDSIAQCRAFDPNRSGLVEIHELVDAVDRALHQCP